jgi:hypothetical protein
VGLPADQLVAIIMAMINGVQQPPAVAPPPTAHICEHSAGQSHHAATLQAATAQLLKLKETNYSQWEFVISLAIKLADLWEYIEGTVMIPLRSETHEYDKYIQESGAVINAITGSLEHKVSYRYLDGTKMVKEAWDSIRKHYWSDDKAWLMVLDKELVNLKLVEGGDAVEHISTFCQLMQQLTGTDFEVKDSCTIAMMYRSLPASYGTWVTIQEQASSKDFKALCTHLESHYHSMIHHSGAPTVTALPAILHSANGYCPVPNDLRPYLANDKDPGNKNPVLADRAKNTCQDCLLTGHRASVELCQQFWICRQLWGPQCKFQVTRQLARTGARRQSNTVDGALAAGTEVVKAQVTTLEDSVSIFPKYDTFPASVKALIPYLAPAALSVGGPTAFLLDSGCQVHLTCIHVAFTQFQELADPIPINSIGSHSVLAMGKGHVELPVSIGDGIAWFQLHDVLYAPKLGRNLVSTGALLEVGLQVSMTTDGATIASQTVPNCPMAHARFVNRLWVLDVEPSVMCTLSAPAANTAMTGVTWHRCLNHIGINALRDLASGGAIPPLTKSDLHTIQNCSMCVLGKGVWLLFPPSSTRLATKPLELIHSDLVCGLDVSISGAHYVATFIDDCTCMALVFPLKHKHELVHTFIQFCTKLELQTEH